MLFCNSFPSTCARQAHYSYKYTNNPISIRFYFFWTRKISRTGKPTNQELQEMKAPENQHHIEPDSIKNMANWFQLIYISLLPFQHFPHLLYLHIRYFFLLPEEVEFIRIKPSQVTESMDALNDGINAGARCRIPQVSVNLLHNWLISENIQRQVNMKCILCYIYSMRRSHFPITH